MVDEQGAGGKPAGNGYIRPGIDDRPDLDKALSAEDKENIARLAAPMPKKRAAESSVDDEQTQTIRIESPYGGYNIVEIGEGNTIRISEADCPDKTCIKTGTLKSEGVPIVCLPHKLVIKFTDAPQNGG